MEIDTLKDFVLGFIEVSAIVLSLAFGLLIIAIVYMYVVDVTQTSQTIRRNYPVIGRFRYFFEHLSRYWPLSLFF